MGLGVDEASHGRYCGRYCLEAPHDKLINPNQHTTPMLYHRSPVITTLRLLSIASNPDAGHYIGMSTKRPLILERRLLGDIRDIKRESKEHDGAEAEVTPVIDLLEEALETLFPLWCRTTHAPAVFGQISDAAGDAVKRILERDRARVQRKGFPGGS